MTGTVLADPAGTVVSGPFLLALVLAVGAGIVSFASPCVLPLVPGYLSYLVTLVGGEGAAELAGARAAAGTATGPVVSPRTDGAARGRVRVRAVVGASWFVTGFTVVFVCESMAVLGLAHSLVANQDLLIRIGGGVTIVLGVAMLGFIGPLQRERRVHTRPRGRVVGPLLLGAFFALGWTVCIGPTLGGVLSLTFSSEWNGNAWRGLVLVIAYCIGLGLPFLLVALGFGWATGGLAFLRRHTRVIQLIGAGLLIAVGIAMVSGVWGHFLAWLQIHWASVGEGWLL
jgi:cytochrome c-type biogenesis protein